MIDFIDAEQLFMLRFLSQHLQAIKKEYLKHKSSTGYVLVKAYENFQAIEAPKFIQRGFNKHQFRNISQLPPQENRSHDDNSWIYYEIYWSHNKSSWYLKEFDNQVAVSN